MNKLRPYLLTATGFVVLIGAIALTGPNTSQAQSAKPVQDVKVVNATSEPLPTQSVGTTNIAGTVGLAPGATIGIDPTKNIVQFTNTDANPLFVRDVSETVLAFQDFLTLDTDINRKLGPIDVSKFKQIRVAVQSIAGSGGVPGASDYSLAVLLSNPSTFEIVLERDLNAAKTVSATKLYDLPGRQIEFFFNSGSGGSFLIQVYGRSN